MLNVGAVRLAVAFARGAVVVVVAMCVVGCTTSRTPPAASAGSSQIDSRRPVSDVTSSRQAGSGPAASGLIPTEPASENPPPSQFAAACGHPGAVVTVVDLPVTVHRKTCDLTGVIIRYGPAGVIVPAPGEGTGAQYDASTGATSLYVDVDAKTGDVTIH